MDAMNTQLTRSWLHLCEDFTSFSNLFYGRLFTASPSLRQLYRNVTISKQDQHLRTTLGALANGQVSTAGLIALGRRYARRGVRPDHYGVMVHTLLWALEHQLRASWTLATQNAWDDTLTRAASIMVASDRRRRHGTVTRDNLIPFPLARVRS